jgi:hypothetical protein
MFKKLASIALLSAINISSVSAVLLTGDYIQLGVDNNGTLGSGSTPPGFGYDPTGTGSFTSGTTYDWFIPGSPWQGFTVSGNGSSYSNINGGSIGITGGSVSDTSGTTAKDLSLLWSGAVTGFADITSSLAYDISDTFIQINTSITAQTNIIDGEYGFFFDPDWFSSSCGDYSTTNTVVSTSQVTSEGCDGTAISLMTDSSVTHGVDTGSWSSDASDYIDGVAGTVQTGDNAIGMGFAFDLLAGESIDLTFYTSFAKTADDLVTIDDVTSVPEPSIIALFGFGIAGLGLTARRRKAA